MGRLALIALVVGLVACGPTDDRLEPLAGTETPSKADDSDDGRRRCEPARSAAEDYDAPELVAAFETSLETLRDWPKPSSKYDDMDDGRAWLCYFTGPQPSIPKAPPGEGAEIFDQVGFLVTDDAEVHLYSFSYADDELNAPPDSKPLKGDE